MIDEELGQPAVISDLLLGIPSAPSQDDQLNTLKNSASGTDAAVPSLKYTRTGSSSRHPSDRFSTANDCRRAGRLSEGNVEPYSPQPYVARRLEINRHYQHNPIAISHPRRHR